MIKSGASMMRRTEVLPQILAGGEVSEHCPDLPVKAATEVLPRVPVTAATVAGRL